MPTLLNKNPAPGKPGIPPRWTSARKQGIGTAYAAASRVWLTIWQGIVTEIYYPTVDHPQVRDWQFLITDGSTFFHEERRDLVAEIDYVDPQALAFRIIQRDPTGMYHLEKTIITDPHSACVLQKVKIVAPPELQKKLRIFSLCAPHLGVGGRANNANVATINGERILVANKGNTWLAMGGDKPFCKASCGYVGVSDGWTDLNDNFEMDWQYDSASDGNVALMGEIFVGDDNEFVAGVGFGHGVYNAATTLMQSLSFPFDAHLERFIGQWKRTGSKMAALEGGSHDGGKLLRASYKVLIAHEDKLNPGAFIASLSIPWGEAKGDEDLGGYHVVWPRDMVNSATGLLAAGNCDTPLRALIFLASVQREDGGFPQNFWINGDAYWSGIQLDEVSFPILLAWRLYRANGLQEFDAYPMVLKAAAFHMRNGPVTQQERWEEVGGFSPSTLAANIAALTCAAVWARERGAHHSADILQDYADYLRCHIEDWTVTTCGDLHPEIKTYFIRANPARQAQDYKSPDEAQITIANLAPWKENVFPARNVVDAGFLELVRYGIYPADNELVVNSLKVIDEVLKVETPEGPCWRRYNHDGYGQQEDGSPFTGYGVGRAWPLLTGERGHYELAAGKDPSLYVETMEKFASIGGTLPEQVWDAEPIPEAHLFPGKPTGSAMPLAWAHAEYIKLLRSIADGAAFDLVPEVKERYIDQPQVCKLLEIWHHNWQVPTIHRGYTLRICASKPFRLVYTFDDWMNTLEGDCQSTSMDMYYIDIETPAAQYAPISFTFQWTAPPGWEGRNYTIQVE